jgi:hypothetical protein
VFGAADRRVAVGERGALGSAGLLEPVVGDDLDASAPVEDERTVGEARCPARRRTYQATPWMQPLGNSAGAVTPSSTTARPGSTSP